MPTQSGLWDVVNTTRITRVKFAISPRRIANTCRDIEQRYSDLDVERRTPYDLEEAERLIRNAVGQGGALEHWTPEVLRALRALPWFLFAESQSSQCLGLSPVLLSRYTEWIKKPPRHLKVRRYIFHLLLKYPSHLPTFQEWLSLGKSLLVSSESKRDAVKKWKLLVNDIGFMTPDGPRRLGDRLAREENPPMTLQELGFTGQLLDSVFLQRSWEHCLSTLESYLKVGTLNAEQLESYLAQLLHPNGELRFPGIDFRVHMTSCLLRPFNAIPPGDELKRTILEFLLRNKVMGHPLIELRRWSGVDEFLRNAVRGWLARTSLKDFFTIISTSALDVHWKYREAFWNAYLDAGHILDAWVVLGPEARLEGRHLANFTATTYGHLSRTPGSQSAILMRVGNLVVSEWSHNGPCSIWQRQDERVPKFGMQEYGPFGLKKNRLQSGWFAHHNSDRYLWQDKIREYIETHAGVSVNKESYRIKWRRH